MKKIFLYLLISMSAFVFAQMNARLIQYPDVSETQITFVYGGDIWVVSKQGGTAIKLSSPAGSEMLPKFSPDGKKIAFTGNYDGNSDIYVIPVTGGIAKRITHHSMTDRILDWYPNGNNLLFASGMYSGRQRFSQLYKVSANGGLPEKLPVPYGEFGSVSKNGKYLAYTKRTRLFRTWKRYRGGTATNIWLFNLNNYKSENITNNDANNELPMWHGNKIYYLSDQGANERFNIWCYDLKTKKNTQITYFKNYDTHFPSIGPKEIVFENAGKLFLLDLKTEKYSAVNVKIVDDFITLKPKLQNVERQITYANPSPDAKRITVEARGEIFSVPAEKGVTKNISLCSGSAQRYPAWSPNGKYIAYWSDKSGEYQLVLFNNKTEKEETLTNFKDGYRYQIFWSPNSEKIAFIDQTMTILLFEIKTKQLTKIDQALYKMHGGLAGFNINWSKNSEWITYSRSSDDANTAIFLYNTIDKKRYQVTSGFYSTSNPAFDPDGKYLYFTINNNFRPLYSDLEGTWIYPNTTKLALATLRNDVKSPLFPQNDEVKIKSEKSKKDKSKKKDSKKNKKSDEKFKRLKIDIAGFESRIVELPVKAGNIGNISAVSGKIIFHRYPNSGSTSKDSPIKYFDLKTRKEQTIIKSATGYKLVANQKNLLVANRTKVAFVKIAPMQKMTKIINTHNVQMTINPKAEWKQILHEAWRLERDMFYDKNMHGVNWKHVYKQYSDLLKYAVSREDVNFLIGELIGELSASHTYKGGGDVERAKRVNVGYLGIDWSVKNDLYRIKKIIKGASWDSEVVSPLNTPGINVKEGDYILAVNGVKLSTDKDPYYAFQGLAGKTIELTINDKPTFENSKKVIVKTLRSETRLRHLNWIEQKRKRVEEATNGRIGYIYVRSTGIDGQNELIRQFYAQFQKDGLIIDERFNSGGQIPDRFIELLNRKPVAFWAVRDGKTWQHPGAANFGPKVMLINGWSGSGGDAFPHYFKQAKIGPLVGTRTWGGLIGISGAPQLIDGGMITVPTFRMFDPNGGWFKEGHGVDPDIEVNDDPTQMANGKDPQLEAAISEILKLLKTNPPVRPKIPPYERR